MNDDGKTRLALWWLLNPQSMPLASLSEDVQAIISAVSSKLPAIGVDDKTEALIEAHRREAAEIDKAKEIVSYNRAKERAEAIAHEGRRITFKSAANIKARPIQWLWEHRMPIGEITLLAGRAGLGKSTFGSQIAAQVTKGTLSPGCFAGQPKDVLIFATEDAWEYTIVPRLMAAGADMMRIHRADVMADDSAVPFNAGLDADRLIRDALAADLDVGLIIFDPLVSALQGRKRNSGDDVRPALEKLKRMAEQMNANVLALVHFNKGGNNQSALERVTGTGEFGNVVRSGLGVAENKEDGTTILSNIKHNLAPSGLPSIVYRIESTSVHTEEGPCSVGKVVIVGETMTTVEDLMQEESDAGSRISDAKTWLRDYLTEHGETPSRDVLKAGQSEEGFSRTAIQGARKALNVQTRNLPTVPRTTTWRLPEAQRELRPFIPGQNG